MLRAVCKIREALHYRRDAFIEGLKQTGYTIVNQIIDPRKGDLLVIWNRQGQNHDEAKRFEKAGAMVIVCENSYMGNPWNGSEWFAMSRSHHNGAGKWPVGGPERFDSWNVELKPWREGGTEVVLLPQRGIGEPGIAMPPSWPKDAQTILGRCRVRPHPGGNDKGIPLNIDLKNAKCVGTWASGAAIKALIMGVPVVYSFEQWIGGPAGRHISKWKKEGLRMDDEARLAMFRRMAWAMYSLEEVRSGIAFGALVTC